jgi:superfamily I DNA/RNA helicase
MPFTLKQTQHYLDDIEHLPVEIRESQLPVTQKQLQEDPHQSALRSHPFNAFRRGRVFRSSVNDQYRVVWWYGDRDQSIILWHVGTHAMIDDLENLKNIPRIHIAREIRAPQINQNQPEKDEQADQVEQILKPEGIFHGISPTHLRLFGVQNSLIDRVRQIIDINELFNLDIPKQAQQILISLYTNPDWTPDNLLDIRQVFYRANADQLEDYCKGKIRKLMLDLSPDQEKVIGTRSEGVLLIKGVAGSGKTTVGVYRALFMSKNRGFIDSKPVLFLTYNETLAQVVEKIFVELTPKDEHKDLSSRIQAFTIRDWCLEFLGTDSRVYDLKKANSMLSSAISANVPKDATYEFLKKEDFIPIEIAQVIKGRGVTTWEEYRNLKRIGRGQPLVESQRQIIWNVYLDYQQRLVDEGVMDEADLIIEALNRLRIGPDYVPYPEVVVDEAQDLTPKALELASVLAGGGRSHGLCLLADPSQSIYYKGISWKDGNIQIHSSRVKTLRKNFRNTKPILEAAWALSKADPQRTLDEAIEPDSTDRPGSRPHVFTVNDQSEQDLKCMKELVINYSQTNQYRLGDIAVLCRTREKTQAVTNYLNRLEIPVCHFREEKFDVFENNVKVITVNSAKGLEFPVVILMNVDEGVIPRRLNHIQDKEDLEAALRIERQLLYVGMTRAADELCLLTTSGKCSRFIKDIPENLLDIKPVDWHGCL